MGCPDGLEDWRTGPDGPGWLEWDGGSECRGFLHVRERVLAGRATFLPAAWSRGELDFRWFVVAPISLCVQVLLVS